MEGDMTDGSGPHEADSGKIEEGLGFLIAGIGASAGGLEALQEFFAQMPDDSGLGFVVVTHQPPGRHSLLPEILARSTQMPVHEVTDGLAVEPDKVFVVPSGKQLSILEGRLHLSALSGKFPIDSFFRSLAFDQREHAVGIVLSGTGSDGTLGVRTIKDAFGMVMVQDSASARYAGMPSSAAATGLADFVLPPSEMPEHLIGYAGGVHAARTERAPIVAGEPLQRILLRLREGTGTDFSVYKMNTVNRRIRRRMQVLQIAEPHQYAQYLEEHPKEIDQLFHEMLINVTGFFRDPEAFTTLGAEVLPELIRSHREEDPFRVWVPGCASGEEAYSVAMVLAETMERLNLRPPVQIYATDLDSHAVETAREGTYSQGIAADVPRDRLEKFFFEEGSSSRIRRELREKIVFAVQNLLKDPPFTKMDLIVCRNVLIYLNAEIQRWILQLFHYALNKGGILFLGSSETIGPFKDYFAAVDAKWKIYRRKEAAAEPLAVRPTRIAGLGLKDTGAHPAGAKEDRQEAQIQKFLLSRFAPFSAVVDERGSILYISGRTGAYLELPEGEPRNNIVDAAREGLRQALHGALLRAVQEKTEIVRDRIRIKSNGEYTDAVLTVTPIQAPASLSGLVLVTIGPPQPLPGPPKSPGLHSPDDQTAELERDLQYAQESLQSTIDDLQTSNEELRASNEELQSVNEELQSTNEELETSKEEMQSLNEELTTVNSELQAKVAELARSNDDMQNLLNSTNMAIVFLDERMHVKRFSEDAKELFHLVPSDVGRPLSDLASNLKYKGLLDDCRDVLKRLEKKEIVVASQDGGRYLLRILPYRTVENRISGVVVTFVNVETLKRAEEDRDFFESIVQTIREPMIVTDGDLKVIAANRAFYETFQAEQRGTIDKRIYDLGNRQWNIPALRKLLEEILPLSKSFSDYRVDHDFPGIGPRTFLLNARRLERTKGEAGMILLSFQDITGGA
jgi:two-component system CheB/CheR fusion protein